MTVPASLGPMGATSDGTLDDADIALLRAELGADVDLTDAQTRYTRLGDVRLVIVEMLRERMAGLLAAPASLTIPGQVSMNSAANIAALQAQLQRVADEAGITGTTLVRRQVKPRRARR